MEIILLILAGLILLYKYGKKYEPTLTIRDFWLMTCLRHMEWITISGFLGLVIFCVLYIAMGKGSAYAAFVSGGSVTVLLPIWLGVKVLKSTAEWRQTALEEIKKSIPRYDYYYISNSTQSYIAVDLQGKKMLLSGIRHGTENERYTKAYSYYEDDVRYAVRRGKNIYVPRDGDMRDFSDAAESVKEHFKTTGLRFELDDIQNPILLITMPFAAAERWAALLKNLHKQKSLALPVEFPV